MKLARRRFVQLAASAVKFSGAKPD